MTTVLDTIQRLLPVGTQLPTTEREPCAVRWQDPPLWPPDVFAVAATLVTVSGCYAHVCVTRGGWSIAGAPEAFATRTQELGAVWAEAAAEDEAGLARLGARLRLLWSELLAAGHHSVVVRLEEELPRWCAAALELLAIADEASAGMGFDYGSRLSALLIAKRFGEHGSSPRRTATLCELVPPEECCVQPRARTPQVGCTVRSLSHNLALLPPTGEVTTRYLNRPDAPHETSLNLLLVPFPYVVNDGVFAEVERHADEGWGTFAVAPSWLDGITPADLGGFLARLVAQSNERLQASDAGELHGIVLPELALTDRFATATAELLAQQTSLELFISGVRAAPRAPGGVGRNTVFSFLFLGQGKQPMSWEQAKHHKWRLDESQLASYGSTLDREVPFWWEDIDVANREVVVHAFREGAMLTTLICEDLARIDPVQHVVRAVGPNLLVALLMDGPQRKERWPARYASVLADDPGTSVLTFTCLATVDRSDRAYAAHRNEPAAARRIVGLWKDELNTVCLDMDPASHGLLLSLSLEQVEEKTMDRRADGGTSMAIRYVAHEELRCAEPLAGAGAGSAPALSVRSPRDENGPDGYPRHNQAFREAADKVVRARKDDAEQARRFLDALGRGLRDAAVDEG